MKTTVKKAEMPYKVVTADGVYYAFVNSFVAGRKMISFGYNWDEEKQIWSRDAKPRKLREIAEDIYHNWKPIHPWAYPYYEAMTTLDTIYEDFMYDSARSVVIYFLGNATMWRGDDARRIKAELNALLKR